MKMFDAIASSIIGFYAGSYIGLDLSRRFKLGNKGTTAFTCFTIIFFIYLSIFGF